MTKGTPDIIYSKLILESGQTGKQIAITQTVDDEFITEVLTRTEFNAFLYITHATIEEAIKWSKEELW